MFIHAERWPQAALAASLQHGVIISGQKSSLVVLGLLVEGGELVLGLLVEADNHRTVWRDDNQRSLVVLGLLVEGDDQRTHSLG